MKPYTIALTLILGISMTLVGCGKGGDAPANDQPAKKVEAFPEGTKITDLFPAAPGAQSTFVSGESEVTLRIKDVSDAGENKLITMDILEGQKVTDTVEWQVGAKGIFQLSARNGQKYTPPQMSVAPDFSSRDEIKYNGKGPFPAVETGQPEFGDIEGILRNRGIETIDTEMGQIEALAVESAYGYKSGGKRYRILNTTWFAPKYGIVRFVQATQREDGVQREVTMKLKGFRSK